MQVLAAGQNLNLNFTEYLNFTFQLKKNLVLVVQGYEYLKCILYVMIVYVMICRFLFRKCQHFVLRKELLQPTYATVVGRPIRGHLFRFPLLLCHRATAVTPNHYNMINAYLDQIQSKSKNAHNSCNKNKAERTFLLRSPFFVIVGNWIDLLFDGKTEKRHICINFVKLPPTLQLIQIKMSHSKTGKETKDIAITRSCKYKFSATKRALDKLFFFSFYPNVDKYFAKEVKATLPLHFKDIF